MKKHTTFPVSLGWRVATWLVLTAQFCLTPVPLLAADNPSQPSLPTTQEVLGIPGLPTPVTVTPNTTPPVDVAPPDTIQFSAAPSDAEFLDCRPFEEPLVPIGGNSTPAENAALAAAIVAFQGRDRAGDVTDLTGFLKANPNSVWRAAAEAVTVVVQNGSIGLSGSGNFNSGLRETAKAAARTWLNSQ